MTLRAIRQLPMAVHIMWLRYGPDAVRAPAQQESACQPSIRSAMSCLSAYIVHCGVVVSGSLLPPGVASTGPRARASLM